jgi:hypothetical protein
MLWIVLSVPVILAAGYGVSYHIQEDLHARLRLPARELRRRLQPDPLSSSDRPPPVRDQAGPVPVVRVTFLGDARPEIMSADR